MRASSCAWVFSWFHTLLAIGVTSMALSTGDDLPQRGFLATIVSAILGNTFASYASALQVAERDEDADFEDGEE